MRRGFTLIEILIGIAILSIIVAGIIAVLRIGDMVWHSDMGLVDLQQAARQAMDGMVRELRASSAVNIDNSDPSHITFTTPQFSDIEFRYIDSNNDSVRDRIIRQRGSETKVLANEINNLSFCWDHGSTCDTNPSGSHVIKIQLKARKTVSQRILSFPVLEGVYLTGKVRLRN